MEGLLGGNSPAKHGVCLCGLVWGTAFPARPRGRLPLEWETAYVCGLSVKSIRENLLWPFKQKRLPGSRGTWDLLLVNTFGGPGLSSITLERRGERKPSLNGVAPGDGHTLGDWRRHVVLSTGEKTGPWSQSHSPLTIPTLCPFFCL